MDKYTVLERYFGYTSFRPGQEALIDAQVGGRDALGIMPTGGGKSICYQIPAMLAEGVTLVISPLISLMTDQVMALKRAGIPAAYINSSLSLRQISLAFDNICSSMYKIIYVAPERLMTDRFLDVAQSIHISMVVVDEAHCISQWGQDFRPSYLRIAEFIKSLSRRPVVSAFTATATARVRDDIERLLELNDPVRVITGFDRPNLRFEVRYPEKKLPALITMVKERLDRCGIVYCATRRDVEKVCLELNNIGVPATRYHAGLSEAERRENQDDFIYDRKTVMVATNAFGMGIDKSNVAYVIHYNMPQSMEAYYQEAGRAGRDGEAAECILLYAAQDIQMAKYMIMHPSENEQLTEAERRQVMMQDLVRLEQMIVYCKTTGCLRNCILEYFGQEADGQCGNCGNCGVDTVCRDITAEAVVILECVQAMRKCLGYNLGAAAVDMVLSGSRAKRVLELKLDKLDAYGRLKKLDKHVLDGMIDALLQQGFLHKDPVHGGVMVTQAGKEVLAGQQNVHMNVRVEDVVKTEQKKTAHREDEGLLSALKNLRLRIAKEEHVPAYIVFSNATLQDMAKKAPVTLIEFMKVSGVGAFKANRYGEAFVAEILKYKNPDRFE